MKLFSIAILASLFLFSCSSDDDSNSDTDNQNSEEVTELQEGWTTERLSLAVESCKTDADDTAEADACECIINETAKVLPFSFFDGEMEPSQAQQEAILAGILNNCTSSLIDF